MSDLDTVLERLITDTEFRRVLATDPAHALHPYRLTADERTLLLTQVSPDTTTGSRVEQRTSKAGMFGLLGELAGVLAVDLGPGDAGSAVPYGHPLAATPNSDAVRAVRHR